MANKHNNIQTAIATLVAAVPEPTSGLPDDIFYYISQTTPLINVDLLISDGNGRTLLAWRDDEFTGVGWHLPGGIVRFKETIEERLEKVAIAEIGAIPQFDKSPIAVHQMIHTERGIRGHFVSFLYRGLLTNDFMPTNASMNHKSKGDLGWHENCPVDLLPVHDIYRNYINTPTTALNDIVQPKTIYISKI